MKTWNTMPSGSRFVASFSGGKDSVLALYKASGEGQPLGLITMFDETGSRSGAHGLSPCFIAGQAEAMGLPIKYGRASWGDYEKVFTGLLADYKATGAEILVTGDLDLPEVDCWHERVTRSVGLGLCSPLWGMGHTQEAIAFVEAGFSSVVVCVNTKFGMRKEDLGRIFDRRFIDELLTRGIDPSAEAGEFHTAVIDGPLFRTPIRYTKKSIRTQNEYFLLDLDV